MFFTTAKKQALDPDPDSFLKPSTRVRMKWMRIRNSFLYSNLFCISIDAYVGYDWAYMAELASVQYVCCVPV